MRVTVCELHDDEATFESDWERLAAHVHANASDLVILPEMPFAPWFGVARTFDASVWDAVERAHQRWLARLSDLGRAAIIGTRPVTRAPRRLNEAFLWDASSGARSVHVKRYLPDEEGVWEASWYHPGDPDFTPLSAGEARIGVLICTEQWSMGHAQRYGKQGVHIIATPRATGRPTVEKWLTGGRAVALVSGAYSLSSNRTARADGPDFGGGGWVVDPDGTVLALTSKDEPVRTVEIDLAIADAAKHTYPRYALD